MRLHMLTGRPGPAPPTHTAAPRTAVSSRKAAHLCQRRAVPCSAASTLEQAQAPAPTPARQPLDVGEVGWRTDFTNEYTAEGRVLGVGAFGKVVLGHNNHNGRLVAIKSMPKVRGKLSRSTTLGKISREVCVMQKAQSASPSVVQLLDCFEDPEQVHLVTELCSGGDLKQYVEAYGTLDETGLAMVAVEALKVIKACHSVGILYADMKPSNLCLMDADAFRTKRHLAHNIRAVDFGCSQQLIGGKTRSSKRSGTLGFLAPEVFFKDHGYKAEVWSTAVTLYWLYARRLPYWSNEHMPRAPTLEDVMKAVTETDIYFDYGPWLSMSSQGKHFLQRCLTRPEDQRMGVDEALEHPWLAALVDQVPNHSHVGARGILSHQGSA